MNTKRVFTLLIAVFFASTFAWTDGASGQQSRAEKRAERAERKADELAERAESLKEEAEEGGGEKAEERAERAKERAEEAEEKAEKLAERAERKQRGEKGAQSRAKDSGDGRTREVALELKGDRGTALSGSCVAGDEETTIEGEVPQSFEYTLNGQEKLECQIEKEGEGTLKVTLTGDGVDAVQRVGPQAASVNLTYGGGGGVSFSTSSSGSTGSASSSSASSSTSTELG